MTAAQRAQRAGHRTLMDAPRGVLVVAVVMATALALAPTPGAASTTTTTESMAVPAAGRAAADPPRPLSLTLLADLAPDGTSHPDEFTPLGDGRVVFSAEGDASDGHRELYITDGTAEGTGLLADLRDGDSSSPGGGFGYRLTATGTGSAVFRAHGDASDGTGELYVTDGTAEGTGLLADLRDGLSSSPDDFAAIGDGRVLFSARGDASNGRSELYITDGTPEGTQLLADLRDGDSSFPRAFAPLGDGRVVFTARSDASDGHDELHITDGTPEGTELLADLRDGDSSRPPGGFEVTPLGDGRALFTARGDASDGEEELYITDGTTGGTALLANLHEGEHSFPYGFTALGDGTAVFGAFPDPANEAVLYATDGTPEGTGLIDPVDSDGLDPDSFTVLEEGLVVFRAFVDGEDFARRLHVTDGTSEGTNQLVSPDAGEIRLHSFGLDIAVLGDGRAVFRARSEASEGDERLHATDGTPEGTGIVTDLAGGARFPEPIAATGDGRALLRARSDASDGQRELHLAGPIPFTPQVTVTPEEGALTVSWEAAEDATPIDSFTVAVTPDGAATSEVTLDGAQTAVTIDSLTNGVVHRVTVTATSMLGDSEPSPAIAAVPGTAITGGVTRIGGANRFETAALLSAHAHRDGARVAYVATGLDFPDALAGGVAAALDGAPILLSAPSALPLETITELTRLEPDRIVVLGGDAVIDEEVVAALTDLAGDVIRLAGATRFHTAAEISRHGFPDGADVVYLATGEDFPDALAAVPAAALDGGPLLLATRDALTEPTATELARLDPARIVLLGGTAALSSGVADAAAAHADVVDRIEGPTRFDTAAAIAADAFGGGAAAVHVATGLAFPDALAAGPVAAGQSAPILLGVTDALTDPTQDAITALDPIAAFVLGGTAALDEDVEAHLDALLAAPASDP